MSIPSHAKKVFSWIVFDIYQWEQEMFDGSIQIFEYAKRPSTVITLPIIDQKIAIAYDRQPWRDARINLFSGSLYSQEDPLVWAKRELEEETGLLSYNRSLYQCYQIWGRVDKYLYYYIAKNCTFDWVQALDPWWEEIEILYYSFDEFLQYMTCSTCHDVYLANHILRLEREWKIDEFRAMLFD
jgi:ADP-ribose pyrophosphatase